jgi:hypothetical protein
MDTETSEQPVVIDVELPDHTEEIKNIANYLDQLKNRFRAGKTNKKLSLNEYEKIQDLLVNTLGLLGKLSTPAFNIEDELEDKYVLAYPSSPQLAKTLWLEHYERIHHKYNTLKNRCFKMLDDVEKEIIQIKKNN